MEAAATPSSLMLLIGASKTGLMSSHSRWVEPPNILPFSIGSGRTSGDAANDAIDAGVYVVAAAGNDGEDDDGDVAHPSSEAGVISVGGVTIKGTHWSGSSKGDNNGRLLPLPILMPRGDPNKKPEVVAPAEGVPVLTEDGGWGIADGTSAATVYVTGALCLLLEQKPELKPEASNGADTVDTVKRWLMDSAVPEEGQTTHDDYYGYGLLNVSGSLTSPLRHEEARRRACPRRAA